MMTRPEPRRYNSRPDGHRTVSLQTLLVALPALAVLPVVAFALSLLYLLWSGRQEETRRDLEQTVATLAVALDREIAGSTRELRRLAEFPSLAPDRLEEFHRYARELVARNEGWDNISVVGRDGRVLLSASLAFGAELPPYVHPHVAAVFRTGEPVLSDIYRSRRSGESAIAVSVPVLRDDEVRWVLTARLDPDVLGHFVAQRWLREGTLASVVDRAQLIVTRSRDAPRFFGQQATPDLMAALEREPERGTARLQTLDGAKVLAAWQRMPSGWTVTIGVPTDVYDAPLRRSLVTLVGFGTIVLAGGVLLSLLLGRRISSVIGSVGSDARALVEGAPVPPRRSSITQLSTLFDSLSEASRLQRDNAVAREQAVEALRASEQRLQLAIDATEAGTFDWDVIGERLSWSGRTRVLFGLAADAPIDAKTFFASVHPDDLGRVHADIDQALAGERDGRLLMEYRVRQADGQVRWLDARGQAHFGVVGGRRRAIRLVGVVIDQTERQLRIEALREADRRKDEFLAMLAHELRNPLAPLRNAITLLERLVPAGTTARTAVEMSDRQVRHMTRLVNDLLDVSRITQGKIELRREPVVVASAVRDAVDAIGPTVAQRDQRLTVRMPEAPPTILADAVRIAQVLENLLSNASKYTDSGGSIDLCVEEDGQEVVIRVTDTGIGIEPDHLAQVFELFTQIDATMDRAEGGLGIGLSLVRRLVEMHDGTVTAHSAGRGCGTSFVVRLPRSETEGAT
jgi:PAS domain S-box-containing protein